MSKTARDGGFRPGTRSRMQNNKPTTQRLFEEACKQQGHGTMITPQILKEAPNAVSFTIRLRNLQK